MDSAQPPIAALAAGHPLSAPHILARIQFAIHLSGQKSYSPEWVFLLRPGEEPFRSTVHSREKGDKQRFRLCFTGETGTPSARHVATVRAEKHLAIDGLTNDLRTLYELVTPMLVQTDTFWPRLHRIDVRASGITLALVNRLTHQQHPIHIDLWEEPSAFGAVYA